MATQRALHRRILTNAFASIIGAIAFHFAPADVHAQQPPDCSGYPEPRVFLESQAWWWLSDKTERVQTGDNFGHIHVGTCFPQATIVSGDVEFDVRVIMHNNPGFIHHLVVQVFDDGPSLCWAGGITCVDLTESPLTCAENQTCTFWFHVTVPTDLVPTNGRKEFRFRAMLEEPDTNRMLPSTGWQAYVVNGEKPLADYRASDMVEARGWYTGANYQNSRLEVLPDVPVSGTWTPTVQMKPGAGGFATTYHIAMIDPNFHSIPPSQGVVVEEGLGEFIGELNIDTTQLSNGWHRLALRADGDTFDNIECIRIDGSLCDSTDSGVLVTWFEVDNGGPRPRPPTDLSIY